MIDLNKEAEKFSRNFTTGKSEETPQEYITDMLVSFTNNSKNIQAKIIQAQIDVLEDLDFNPSENIVDFILNIKYKVKELQQQLKQLEDETNNKQNNP